MENRETPREQRDTERTKRYRTERHRENRETPREQRDTEVIDPTVDHGKGDEHGEEGTSREMSIRRTGESTTM